MRLHPVLEELDRSDASPDRNAATGACRIPLDCPSPVRSQAGQIGRQDAVYDFRPGRTR